MEAKKKRVMRNDDIPFQIGRLGAALTLNENRQKKRWIEKNIQNRWEEYIYMYMYNIV